MLDTLLREKKTHHPKACVNFSNFWVAHLAFYEIVFMCKDKYFEKLGVLFVVTKPSAVKPVYSGHTI